MNLAKTVIAIFIFSTLASTAAAENETNMKSAWIGEWVGYDQKTNAPINDEKISVTEFDGELNFSSTAIGFRDASNQLLIIGGHCTTQKLSKDFRKVLISHNNCGNPNFNGIKLICDISKNNPSDKSTIICNAFGTSKYFRRK